MPRPSFGRNETWKKIRFGLIGIGGIRGGAHVEWTGQYSTVTAICDVDKGTLGRVGRTFPHAKQCTNYRELFEKSSDDIDAAVVCTPDHNHYSASMRALKLGKHVFCEKPLAWSVRECENLAAEAVKQMVATQMGNQGNAGHGWRIADEYIKGGAIGEVTKCHIWTNRPLWPQGKGRPRGKDPVPDSLDWDSWIGPAPMRPFIKEVYHPGAWRGFYDFGAGALGDMGCHMTNVMFQVMKPGYPTNVELVTARGRNDDQFPKSEIIKWVFPRTDQRPGFSAFWYDGGNRPKTPEELEEGRRLPETGVLFHGTEGKMIVAGDMNNSARLIPEAKSRKFGRPKQIHERFPGHFEEFLMAASGEKPWHYPGSNFTYSGPMTAVIQLGNITEKLGGTLKFDVAR